MRKVKMKVGRHPELSGQRRKSGDRGLDLGRPDRGDGDSRQSRESISGKRSGKEDNPGRRDSGRQVEGGGHGKGH